MLAKAQRYFSEREVTLAFRKGKKIQGQCFLVRYFQTDRKKTLVVVSKKISKSAVVRNRLRRLAYRVLAELWSDLPSGLWYFSFQTGFDCTEELLHNDLNKIISHVTTKTR